MDIILKAKLNAYTKGTISGATLSKIYTSKIDEQVPLDLIDEETKLPIYSIKKHFVIEITDNPQYLLEVLQNINKIIFWGAFFFYLCYNIEGGNYEYKINCKKSYCLS